MTLQNVPKYGPHNFAFGSRHRGTDVCSVCELEKAACEKKYKPTVKTCQWSTREEPLCGEPAPYRVKVKTKVTTATVDLCKEHKAIHDENFARLRSDQHSK